MKRFLLLIILLAVGCFHSGIIIAQTSANLVKNSSFETGSNNKPDNWIAASYGDATLSWTNSVAHSGSYSISIGNISSTTQVQSKWVSDFITVTPSTAHTFSCWAYINKAPGKNQYYNFSIIEYDVQGNELPGGGGWSINEYATQNQWQQYTSTLIYNSNTAKVRFTISFQNYSNGNSFDGSCFFDDFELKQVVPVVSLNLIKPAFGENIRAKTSYTFQWTSQNITSIDLTYYISGNGSGNWVTLAKEIPASQGSYTWMVPDTVTDNIQINITDSFNSYYRLYRNARIIRSSVQVTKPNGGENWAIGSTQNITWTSSSVTNVKLEYTTNNGTSWSTIIATTPASVGTYVWTVPNTPSTNCKVRISDVSDATLIDESNAAFTISKSLLLATPNGGESWQASSIQNITWTSGGVTNVKLEYTSNNGSSWSTIIASTPASSGAYAWTIPNALSSNCKIRISDVSDANVKDESDAVFIISKTFMLTKPNGGENWSTGSSQTITWTTSNVSMIKIEYSTDSGNSWTTIETNFPASSGTYTWTVPNVTSTNCKVRISEVGNLSLSSTSSAVFTISMPNLVKNPSLESGSNSKPDNWTAVSYGDATLNWTKTVAHTGSYSLSIGNVSNSSQIQSKWVSDYYDVTPGIAYNYSFWIYLTKQPVQNQYFELEITQYDSNGNYESSNSWGFGYGNTTNTWQKFSATPILTAKAAKVRITIYFYNYNTGNSFDGICYFDDFEIKQINPIVALDLLKPQGGESIKAKSVYTIQWTSQNIPLVDLRYWISGPSGGQYVYIAKEISASLKSYTWTVPDTVTDNFQFYINDSFNSNYQVSRPIKITKSSVIISKPNGGENWIVGSSQNITWTSSSVTNVKLEYTTNNGGAWATIVSNTPASAGSYSWIVPNVASANCKVRISDANDASLFDESDAVFTISKSILVSKPNGGENWSSGSSQSITWTSAGVTNVKLEYTTNNGTLWSTIIASTSAAAGSYSWTVPGTLSTTCKVRVSDVTDVNIKDESDLPFTISKTFLLASPNGGENWSVGSTQNITWSTSDVTNIKIEYSTDGGTSWITINASTPASTGSYAWTIPNTLSSNCKVRISEVGNTLFTSTSAASFTLSMPNLVQNSSVEIGSGGKPSNWTATSAGDATLNWTNSIAHTGSYSLSIGNISNTTQVQSKWMSDFIDVTPTTAYRFSCWAYSNKLPANNQYFSWHIVEYDSQGIEISSWGQVVIGSFSVLNQWQQSSMSKILSSKTVKVKFRMIFENYSNGNSFDGTCYYDDFELRQVYPLVSLNLMKPLYGESVRAKTNYNIQWTSQNIIAVDLKYYISGNVNSGDISIAKEIPASQGSYTWSVPDTVTNSLWFTISDSFNSNNFIQNNVRIIRSSVKLTAPNGGENWPIGSRQLITWTSNSVTDIKLEYTTNNGTNWSTIIASTPASAGSYRWDIPSTASINAKLRISDANDATLFDESDAVFIISKTLKLLTPNGGENWVVGSIQNITWTSGGVTDVKLEYSVDNGTNWITIVDSTPANGGSYVWTTPNAQSANCKIRISAVSNPTLFDLSDAIFTISKTLTLTKPNGGEIWSMGSSQSITWASLGITDVKLEYTNNNGTNWNTIIASTPANVGSYAWTIPNSLSANCKVRISDVTDPNVKDESDATFTIAKTLILTGPIGGETWTVGTAQNITWTSNDVTNVMIEYSTDGGNRWISIIASTPAGSGSFTWSIPNTPSINCKVRISEVGNASLNSVSAASFTLSLPSLVKNTSLETGSGNNPDNWTAISSGDAALKWTNELAHTGNYSIGMGNISNSAQTQSSWESDYMDVTASIAYQYSCWAYLNKQLPTNQGYAFLIREFDSQNKVVTSSGWSISSSDPMNQWKKYSNGIIFSSKTAKVKLIVVFEKYGNTNSFDGTCYFDDFELIQVFPVLTLSLTKPSEGETLLANSNYNIQWTSQNVNEVDISYVYNNAPNWISIATKVSSSKGSYSWNVPDIVSDQVRILISDSNNGRYYVTSPGNGFKISKSSFQLLTPNGGENWTAGSVQNITWAVNGVTNVKLEYTTNNGTNWITIIASTPANAGSAGSYLWTVPATSSSQCKVRVSDVNNPATNDLSNSTFTISTAGSTTIAVTSPNGGETWTAGSIQNITWTSSNIEKVTLQYSTDDGTTWSTIAGSVSASTGSYPWTIPDLSSSRCRISINDAINGYPKDQSDGSFTIIPKSTPAITVISPNGGEIWQVGFIKNILWTSNNVTNVKIEYTTNNGTNWITIIASTPAASSSYAYTVPNNPSTNCKVRISDVSNSALNDISDNTFTISIVSTPTITVTSPNGGENWQVGSSKNITWTSNSVTNVKIEYTTNNGTTWLTIVTSTSAAGGTYSWPVANTLSTQCKIKISDVSNNAISDISDNSFTISAVVIPTIIVTSPNGGENWQVSSPQAIMWTSSNVGSIKIEYSTNNGLSWESPIAAEVPASGGIYSWKVPNTISTQCKVRLTDVTNSSISSTSSNPFAIYSIPSSVTLAHSVNAVDVSVQSNYRMFGAPGISSYPVSQFLRGTQGTDWQLYYCNGNPRNYVAFDGSTTFMLKPGVGYWILSKQVVTISGSATSVTLDNTASYSIPLNSGWNIISNPFEKSVVWSQVAAKNGVSDSLWDFTGNWNISSTLEPYKGYFFWNRLKLSGLKIPYAGTLGKIALHKIATEEKIKILLLQNNLAKSEVMIGFDPNSSSGFDERDVLKPVSDFEKERLVIKNENLETDYKYLYADYRSTKNNQTYLLNLKLLPNQQYTLRLEGLRKTNNSICLIDEQLGNIYEFREDEIKVKSAKLEKNYLLVIGDNNYVQDIKRKYELPNEFKLSQNFPNPFNPATTIHYSIAKTGKVTLKIFDLLGREITEIVNENQESGRYEVSFDAIKYGLTSGVYFYRLESNGNSQTKKLMLLK